MPDIDLDALLRPKRWDGKTCTVTQAILEISDEGDREKVRAACDNHRVPAHNVAAAFTQLLGDSPASGTIRRHQNRHRDVSERCGCP